MAELVNIPRFFLPSIPGLMSQGSLNTANQAIDADGEKGAVIFSAPKSGDITAIRFSTGTVTTSNTNAIVGLQGVSNGEPDGTYLSSGNAKGTITAALTANTYYEVTLGTAYGATAGDYLSAIFELDGYNSDNLNILMTSGTNGYFPYFTHYYSAAWNKRPVTPMIAIKYSDGYTILAGTLPVTGATLNPANSGGEAGNYFISPITARAMGIWAYFSGINTGDNLTFKLLDSSNNVLATTNAFDSDMVRTTTISLLTVAFNSTYIIKKKVPYRIIVNKEGTTNQLLYQFNTQSSGDKLAFPGAGVFYKTTRNSGGAWTDVDTDFVTIGLMIDMIEPSVRDYLAGL